MSRSIFQVNSVPFVKWRCTFLNKCTTRKLFRQRHPTHICSILIAKAFEIDTLTDLGNLSLIWSNLDRLRLPCLFNQASMEYNHVQAKTMWNMTFCSFHLDLELMTLALKNYVDTMKMYLYRHKNEWEFLTDALQKFSLNRFTYR